jgi:hypothetical protein
MVDSGAPLVFHHERSTLLSKETVLADGCRCSSGEIRSLHGQNISGADRAVDQIYQTSAGLFVGTVPLRQDGLVNVSLKGLRTHAVIDPHTMVPEPQPMKGVTADHNSASEWWLIGK